MSTATDIADLKKRMASAESTLKTMATKNVARDSSIASLLATVASLADRIAAVESSTSRPEPVRTVTVVPSGGDDRAAIQAAVDSLAAAGGGVVQLTEGTYLLSAGVTVNADCGANVDIKSGVSIVGAGTDKTVIRPTVNGRHPFAASQQSGVGVRDLSIVGAGGSAMQDGVKFYCCDEVTVARVDASGLYIGLALYGCRRSTVTACHVHDCRMGIVPAESRLGMQSTADVVVRDCTVLACSEYGFRPSGYAACDGGEVVSRVSGVTIIDCTADACACGLLARYATALNVVRFKATSYGWGGIFLNGVTDSTFSACEPAPYISTSAEDVADYGASSGIKVS